VGSRRTSARPRLMRRYPNDAVRDQNDADEGERGAPASRIRKVDGGDRVVASNMAHDELPCLDLLEAAPAVVRGLISARTFIQCRNYDWTSALRAAPRAPAGPTCRCSRPALAGEPAPRTGQARASD